MDSASARVARALKDPNFKPGRYIDDEIRDLSPGDLVRICLIDEDNKSHDVDHINAVGEIARVSGNSCYVTVFGGRPVKFSRGDIELMPTGFNPHYDSKSEHGHGV